MKPRYTDLRVLYDDVATFEEDVRGEGQDPFADEIDRAMLGSTSGEILNDLRGVLARPPRDLSPSSRLRARQLRYGVAALTQDGYPAKPLHVLLNRLRLPS